MADSIKTGLVVRSSVRVPISPDAAFRLFTDGATGWWPLPTHSVHEDEATSVVYEPRVGGRVYETTQDGRTAEWGIVSAWEPGARLAMSWHPGNEPALATQVDIRFSATSDGDTLVDLVHTGWEARGADAEKMAAGYDSGWRFVLGRYAAAA